MANVSAASPASFSASSFAFVLPPLAFMLSAGLAAVVLLGCSQRVLAELPWLPAAITTSGRMVASLLAAAVSRGLPASVAAGGGAGGTAVGVATMAAAGQQGGASVMAAARGALLRQGLSAGDASLRTLLLTLAPVAVEQVGATRGGKEIAVWRPQHVRVGFMFCSRLRLAVVVMQRSHGLLLPLHCMRSAAIAPCCLDRPPVPC